mmetsp:Transcript_26638/g.67063  ORF Transcript_26638/g.67063 Transcript_26638/m.67063 type:complete len:636 (-) Transcript_26638:252-2159(-)
MALDLHAAHGLAQLELGAHAGGATKLSLVAGIAPALPGLHHVEVKQLLLVLVVHQHRQALAPLGPALLADLHHDVLLDERILGAQQALVVAHHGRLAIVRHVHHLLALLQHLCGAGLIIRLQQLEQLATAGLEALIDGALKEHAVQAAQQAHAQAKRGLLRRVAQAQDDGQVLGLVGAVHAGGMVHVAQDLRAANAHAVGAGEHRTCDAVVLDLEAGAVVGHQAALVRQVHQVHRLCAAQLLQHIHRRVHVAGAVKGDLVKAAHRGQDHARLADLVLVGDGHGLAAVLLQHLLAVVHEGGVEREGGAHVLARAVADDLQAQVAHVLQHLAGRGAFHHDLALRAAVRKGGAHRRRGGVHDLQEVDLKASAVLERTAHEPGGGRGVAHVRADLHKVHKAGDAVRLDHRAVLRGLGALQPLHVHDGALHPLRHPGAVHAVAIAGVGEAHVGLRVLAEADGAVEAVVGVAGDHAIRHLDVAEVDDQVLGGRGHALSIAQQRVQSDAGHGLLVEGLALAGEHALAGGGEHGDLRQARLALVHLADRAVLNIRQLHEHVQDLRALVSIVELLGRAAQRRVVPLQVAATGQAADHLVHKLQCRLGVGPGEHRQLRLASELDAVGVLLLDVLVPHACHHIAEV